MSPRHLPLLPSVTDNGARVNTSPLRGHSPCRSRPQGAGLGPPPPLQPATGGGDSPNAHYPDVASRSGQHTTLSLDGSAGAWGGGSMLSLDGSAGVCGGDSHWMEVQARVGGTLSLDGSAGAWWGHACTREVQVRGGGMLDAGCAGVCHAVPGAGAGSVGQGRATCGMGSCSCTPHTTHHTPRTMHHTTRHTPCTMLRTKMVAAATAPKQAVAATAPKQAVAAHSQQHLPPRPPQARARVPSPQRSPPSSCPLPPPRYPRAWAATCPTTRAR